MDFDFLFRTRLFIFIKNDEKFRTVNFEILGGLKFENNS